MKTKCRIISVFARHICRMIHVLKNFIVKPMLSKHLRESQQAAVYDRCLLNTGKFIHI